MMIPMQQIRKNLPCKSDFLLLDRVQKVDDNHYIALKCVTITELYFIGHFAGHPIMPGVLEVEAIAQLAELATWERLDPERKYDFYIKKLSRVKFRKPNNPGDRLLIDLQIVSIADGEASLTATVINNSGVACQAQMVVGIRDKWTEIPMPVLFNEFDKSESSWKDVNGVMELIPHRYPFQFVDYVSKIEGTKLTGVKNTTNTDMTFRVYPDGYTVMTGSVHPEIIAQAGCIYMLSSEAFRGKIAYFMSIESAEFFRPVFPGDQLRLEMDIPDNSKRFGKGEGFMYVENDLATKINMTFAIVDR